MRTFARHDLVTIAPAARKQLSATVAGGTAWPAEEVDRLVYTGYDGVFVPGIVARQEDGVNGLLVGLSAPYRANGMRLRASAVINPADVVAVQTPYDVAGLYSQAKGSLSLPDSLDGALAAAADAGLDCGIFGSCALALATGLGYCHPASDVDLVVRMGTVAQLQGFFDALCTLEKSASVRTDVEVQLPGGWGIKLAELFDNGATVLAKGFDDVRLFSKEEVFAMDHSRSFQ